MSFIDDTFREIREEALNLDIDGYLDMGSLRHELGAIVVVMFHKIKVLEARLKQLEDKPHDTNKEIK